MIFKCALLIAITQAPFAFSQAHLGHSKRATVLQDSLRSAIITIEKGDALFIDSNIAVDGYFKVVHLQTDKTGYVKEDDVKVDKKFDTESSFKAIKSEEKDPTLKIHNNSDYLMSMKIAGKEISLTPHETTTIQLFQGKYYYQVSSPSFKYHYGHETLEEYKLYEWEFYVEN